MKELDSAVKSLAEAKQLVMKACMESQSPSIMHTAQVTVDHIDSAYLWMSQLSHFLEMVSEEGVEKAVAAASAEGAIMGDFSNPPKA